MRTVITYGTFDLFHVGHLKLFERLSALGDRLYVGVSTDEFNANKGKKLLFLFLIEYRLFVRYDTSQMPFRKKRGNRNGMIFCDIRQMYSPWVKIGRVSSIILRMYARLFIFQELLAFRQIK